MNRYEYRCRTLDRRGGDQPDTAVLQMMNELTAEQRVVNVSIQTDLPHHTKIHMFVENTHWEEVTNATFANKTPECKQDVVDLLFAVQAGSCSCRRASDILFPHMQAPKDADVEIEDEDQQTISERVSDIMSDTCRSWGDRMVKLMNVHGLDYGDADAFNWAMQREMFRLFLSVPAARDAFARDDMNFPPLGMTINY